MTIASMKDTLPDLASREEAARLYDILLAAEKALADAPEDADTDALDNAITLAEQAYNDHESPGLYFNSRDESKYRCAVSGVPIWGDEDEYLEDPVTGEAVLRWAVGLPARPEEEEAEEIGDEATA